MRLVKPSEKLAEEFEGGSQDNFEGRGDHWAAGKVVIIHGLDVEELLIIWGWLKIPFVTFVPKLAWER